MGLWLDLPQPKIKSVVRLFRDGDVWDRLTASALSTVVTTSMEEWSHASRRRQSGSFSPPLIWKLWSLPLYLPTRT